MMRTEESLKRSLETRLRRFRRLKPVRKNLHRARDPQALRRAVGRDAMPVVDRARLDALVDVLAVLDARKPVCINSATHWKSLARLRLAPGAEKRIGRFTARVYERPTRIPGFFVHYVVFGADASAFDRIAELFMTPRKSADQHRELGRLLGYSRTAIREFVQQLPARPQVGA